MTSDREKTIVEQLEENETSAVELAAARATVQTLDLLNSALAESGRRQKDLAAALGVTEGRVSQVIGGDGNIRVTTLARVLRASGYRLNLGAEPVIPGKKSLPQRTRRWRNSAGIRVLSVPGVSTLGAGTGLRRFPPRYVTDLNANRGQSRFGGWHTSGDLSASHGSRITKVPQ